MNTQIIEHPDHVLHGTVKAFRDRRGQELDCNFEYVFVKFIIFHGDHVLMTEVNRGVAEPGMPRRWRSMTIEHDPEDWHSEGPSTIRSQGLTFIERDMGLNPEKVEFLRAIELPTQPIDRKTLEVWALCELDAAEDGGIRDTPQYRRILWATESDVANSRDTMGQGYWTATTAAFAVRRSIRAARAAQAGQTAQASQVAQTA